MSGLSWSSRSREAGLKASQPTRSPRSPFRAAVNAGSDQRSDEQEKMGTSRASAMVKIASTSANDAPAGLSRNAGLRARRMSMVCSSRTRPSHECTSTTSTPVASRAGTSATSGMPIASISWRCRWIPVARLLMMPLLR